MFDLRWRADFHGATGISTGGAAAASGDEDRDPNRRYRAKKPSRATDNVSREPDDALQSQVFRMEDAPERGKSRSDLAQIQLDFRRSIFSSTGSDGFFTGGPRPATRQTGIHNTY